MDAQLTFDGRTDAKIWRAADRAAADCNVPRDDQALRASGARAGGLGTWAAVRPGGRTPGAAVGSGRMRQQETAPFQRELRAASDLHGGHVASDLHAADWPRGMDLNGWRLWALSPAWALAAPADTPAGALAQIASAITTDGPAAAGYVIEGQALVPWTATGPQRSALARAARGLLPDGLPSVPIALYYG